LNALLLAMADFLDPGRGPDQRGDFRISPIVFVAMLVAGFVIGTVGHLARSRTLQAVGIGLIFLATVLVPLALGVSR